MKKVLVILGLAAVLLMVLAGCSQKVAAQGGTPPATVVQTTAKNPQGGSFPATVVTPTVNADTVSIPVGLVNSKHNIRFDMTNSQTTMSFMAYTFNGGIQVRSSICVPCRGRSFTLSGDKLICDTCGTVFSAKDGTGISGVSACQSYAKAAVPFTTTADGNIVMQKADLVIAFNLTQTPGKGPR